VTRLAEVEVDGGAVRVRGVRGGLPAELGVARDRALVRDLDDDALPERTRVARRVHVARARHLEAAAARVARARAGRGAERELRDRGGVAGRRLAAGWCMRA
jgi:hypothetical protein